MAQTALLDERSLATRDSRRENQAFTPSQKFPPTVQSRPFMSSKGPGPLHSSITVPSRRPSIWTRLHVVWVNGFSHVAAFKGSFAHAKSCGMLFVSFSDHELLLAALPPCPYEPSPVCKGTVIR